MPIVPAALIGAASKKSPTNMLEAVRLTEPPVEVTGSRRLMDAVPAFIWIEPPAVSVPWARVVRASPSEPPSGPVAVSAIDVPAVIGAPMDSMVPVADTAPFVDVTGALIDTGPTEENSEMFPAALSDENNVCTMPPAPVTVTPIVPVAVTGAGTIGVEPV
jgi:hypothetical protein